MSYSTFKLSDLTEKYGIIMRDQKFIPKLERVEPSERLVKTLELTDTFYINNEKTRSELFITPVLAELGYYYSDKIAIYSGEELVGNTDENLTGVCDFIIGKAPAEFPINAPVLVVSEAKKQDFDGGYVQCCAELLGARIFNERKGKPIPVLYGIVSTGDTWRFVRLTTHHFVRDKRSYSIENMGGLLAALKWVVGEALSQVPDDEI